MDWVFDPAVWASFLTLSVLEIVLGVDNVIFISIVASKLEKSQRTRARLVGLTGALVMRVAFLWSVVWLTKATEPLFSIGPQEVSTRDLILLAGGLFLLYKGTVEIHEMVEGAEHAERPVKHMGFLAAVAQIMVLDLVFSIDSVITAVGLTQNLPVMIAAIVVAIIVMMVASEGLGRFIDRHPTTKMLALAFLLMVGLALVADSLHQHINRGYLYFAIAFSIGVEVLNITVARRRQKGHEARGAGE